MKDRLAAAILLKIAGDRLTTRQQKVIDDYCADKANEQALKKVMNKKVFREYVDGAAQSKEATLKLIHEKINFEQPQGGGEKVCE